MSTSQTSHIVTYHDTVRNPQEIHQVCSIQKGLVSGITQKGQL